MVHIKILNIKLLAIILKIFWLFPLKHKRILFISFGGNQFNDSPRYVYDYLKQHFRDLELLWVSNSNLKEDGIKTIKKGSFKYFYTFCTSKVVLINDSINLYLPVRKNQYLINTWHGGGWFKKVGLTNATVSAYDKFYFKTLCKKHSCFVASSEYFVKTVLKASFGYKGNILRSGMQRNAIFFQDNKNRISKIKRELKIDEDKLVILYAPTFRSYEIDSSLERLDFNLLEQAVKNRFNKDVVFLYRAHHLIKENFIDTRKVYDVTNYPDMQNLLLICDILVSDYSSCMWDAAIQKKLVVVFAPDANKYSSNRGFFLDIEKWPFLISFTNETMVDRILKYEESTYLKNLNNLLLESKSYENSRSVVYMVNVILKMLQDQDYRNELNPKINEKNK